MDPLGTRIRPYALAAGEGGKYRFEIDISVNAGEAQRGSSAAFPEYGTRQSEMIARPSLSA